MLEKAIVASTNAAQMPDRIRRPCAFGLKSFLGSANIGEYFIIISQEETGDVI